MQREPVRRAVMMLGWTGSKLRHVRKHEGCWPPGTAAISENVTIDETFARNGRAALREKARRVVAEAWATEAPKLYAHVFSNGGCLLLLEVLAQLEPTHLDGVVYDSAPSPTISPVAGPLIAWLSGGSTMWERLVKVYLTLWPAFLAFPGRMAHMVHFNGLFDVSVNVPHASVNVPRRELFMYSDGDRIVWSNHVDQFVRRRRDQGAVVETETFGKDSPHVGHFRTHPGAYRAAVGRWVEAVEK